MAKGVSIRFDSYQVTIPKLLKFIKFHEEIKKHHKIILKPNLGSPDSPPTPVEFTEQVLIFCKENNPQAEILIAEGADGISTSDLFKETGYQDLAEKYNIGLVDFNETETQPINNDFLKFDSILYPSILLDSYVISLPFLQQDETTGILGSLENRLGAFPAKHYSGFFSSTKNKIRKWPIHYSIHDILKCKMPDFAIIDASSSGSILAGQPLEMDKQAAQLLKQPWQSIKHLKLVDESFTEKD
jgi:uncharacterized protein (DUF362 family)